MPYNAGPIRLLATLNDPMATDSLATYSLLMFYVAATMIGACRPSGKTQICVVRFPQLAYGVSTPNRPVFLTRLS
jgi:hypothetical protein